MNELFKYIFKRHRVRASVYHAGAVIFLFVASVYYIIQGNPFGWFDAFCVCYFVFDYVAEMYDPHPDLPGPWFKAHFHRFFDDSNDDE